MVLESFCRAIGTHRHWFARWLKKSNRRTKPVSSLGLQNLERRLAPANASLVAGILTVDYTAVGTTAESVTLTNDGTNIVLAGNVSGATSNLVTAVNRIVIQDSGGSTNQTVTFLGTKAYTLSAGLTSTGVEDVVISNAINATGSSSISVTSPRRIFASAGISTDTGAITLNANTQPSPGTGSFIGIEIASGSSVASNSGNVTLQAKGGSGAAGNQIAVLIAGVVGGSTTGAVNVTGTGGLSSGTSNYGVNISSGTLSSGGGNVSITGLGGGTGSSTSNYGVFLDGSGNILAGGTGTITIQGTGGSTTGNDNNGVALDGSVNSAGGAVSINGTGTGSSIAGLSIGVRIKSSAQVIVDKTGPLTVQGTGAVTSGNNNYGVLVEGLLQTFDGNTTVTGKGGGTGASTTNRGVFVDLGGQIMTTGTGTVTVTGTGGASTGKFSDGVAIGDSGQISSLGGAVSITGISGNTQSAGVVLDIGASAASGGTANLTFVTDSLVADLSSTIRAGFGSDAALIIKTRTAGTRIELGGADVLSGSPLRLGLSADEFFTFSVGSVLIGDATSGPITLSSAIATFGTIDMTLITGSTISLQADLDSFGGDITFASAGAVTQTAGTVLAGTGKLTLQMGAGQTATFNSTGNTAAQFVIPTGNTAVVNGSFDSIGFVQVNGTLSGSGSVGGVTVKSGGTVAPGTAKLSTANVAFEAGSVYAITFGGSIAATGTVNLGNATLTGSTAATPRFGQVFKIIENNAADAVTGTFNGIAEGATINVSGYPFRLSYKGTDGNDVIVSAGIPLIASGAGQGGGPHVIVRNADNSVRFSFFAYGTGFTGGVRVATGDINGDGTADIITATGPGGGPHVRVFNGSDGKLLSEFFAYAASTTAGVFVGTGDVNGDGQVDIITGVGAGVDPRVRVFSGSNLNGSPIRDFIAYPGFKVGVTVAGGDFNSDGRADIVTGPEAGNPHIKIFNGLNTSSLIGQFFAYNPIFPVGAYVSVGDVNGDGRVDIVTGAGQPGGPHLKAFSGTNFAMFKSLFAYNTNFTGGVRVAVADVNADGFADIIHGSGPGLTPGPNMKWRDGRTDTILLDIGVYGSFQGGMYVG